MNYIDDFTGAEHADRALEAYHALADIMQQIGMIEEPHKAEPPDTVREVLGITFNTSTMTISIAAEKVEAIREMLMFEQCTLVTLQEWQMHSGRMGFHGQNAQGT